MKRIICLFIVLTSCSSFAWTKRGHEIVASVAARILEEKKDKKFLRSHEFDMGYYSNVPDLIWRAYPEPISKTEAPEHYMDWTKDFEKTFGSPKNLPLEFSEFKKKMGKDFKVKTGVVPYRIHGLIKRCKTLAQKVTRAKQGPLLVCLGELSHYTGDLSMPLHVSENHDGEMTNQKGIHGYFESFLVDQLDPEIKIEVEKEALSTFENSEMYKLTAEAAVRWLMADSLGRVDELLKLDKAQDRKNVKMAKVAFKPLILNRLVQGAILTAMVWNEILEPVTEFDDDHFYYWDGKPEYVWPGKE